VKDVRKEEKEVVMPPRRTTTLAQAYHALCQGEAPWVALGAFLHAWAEAYLDERLRLVEEPLVMPDRANAEHWRWAVFCAGAVEWLCAQAQLPCPTWAGDPCLRLDAPWYDFDSPGSGKEEVRRLLQQTTPEPLRRRNVWCGDRVFATKYEYAGHPPSALHQE
jgi:hypothetical protein